MHSHDLDISALLHREDASQVRANRAGAQRGWGRRQRTGEVQVGCASLRRARLPCARFANLICGLVQDEAGFR